MGSERFHDALREGTQIGNVVLGEVLGQGGEGIVYLAEHPRYGRVVVKEYWPSQICSRARDGSMIPSIGDRQDALRAGRYRFLELGKRLIKLHQHQNIVLFYDLIEANKTCYLVMQYIEGPTLEKELASGNFTTPDAIRDLADQLSSALVHLHDEEIWHRDISPDNVLISKRHQRQRAFLIDFNAAKDLLFDAPKSIFMLTKSGYSPIEQYSSDPDQMAPTADIYSASAVLYYVIAGERPVDATRRTSRPLRNLSEIAGGKASPAMLAAIHHGLAVEAVDRPQDARTWRRELGFGNDSSSSGIETKTDTKTQAKTHRRIWWVVFALLLVAALVAGLWWRGIIGPKPTVVGPTPIPTPTPKPSPSETPPSSEDAALTALTKSGRELRPGVWLLPPDVTPDPNPFLSSSGDKVRSNDFATLTISWTPSIAGVQDKARLPGFPLWQSNVADWAYGNTVKLVVDPAKLADDDPLRNDPSFPRLQAAAKYLTAEISVAKCVRTDAPKKKNATLRVPCLLGDWSLNATRPDGDKVYIGDIERVRSNIVRLKLANQPEPGTEPTFYPEECSVTIEDRVVIQCPSYARFELEWSGKDTLSGTWNDSPVTFTRRKPLPASTRE